jgi:hypothetical protein
MNNISSNIFPSSPLIVLEKMGADDAIWSRGENNNCRKLMSFGH